VPLDERDNPDEPVERLHISLAQVAASSAAAVSAAVLCSLFGVAGTIVGTAVASVLATVGSSLYAHTLRRTKARLRRLHQAGASSPPLREVLRTAHQQGRALLGQVRWRYALPIAAIVFVVSVGAVTAIEAGSGQTLAKSFGVSHSGGHGTSVGSIFNPTHHHSRKPKPKPTPTVTKTVTSTPSASSSGSPSQSPSHSASASPSHTPSKTPSHSPTTSPSSPAAGSTPST